MGKFYELFHMDAVIAVNELGLIYMKVRKLYILKRIYLSGPMGKTSLMEKLISHFQISAEFCIAQLKNS